MKYIFYYNAVYYKDNLVLSHVERPSESKGCWPSSAGNHDLFKAQVNSLHISKEGIKQFHYCHKNVINNLSSNLQKFNLNLKITYSTIIRQKCLLRICFLVVKDCLYSGSHCCKVMQLVSQANNIIIIYIYIKKKNKLLTNKKWEQMTCNIQQTYREIMSGRIRGRLLQSELDLTLLQHQALVQLCKNALGIFCTKQTCSFVWSETTQLPSFLWKLYLKNISFYSIK